MGLKKRVLVLASGRGSNFCAIADAISLGIIPNASIVGVISNKPEAKVLEHAKDRNISGFVIESNQYRKHGKLDRNAYEEKLLNLMLSLKPDLICLAGYMLVLGKKIVEAFPKKIINIHPSLLPKFRGLHAQKQALESGDKITGCTVHWVTEGLDEGLAILQAEVPILSGDNEESLSLRMLPIEHQTYISALKLILK
ncbi:MAG: phosphoribosylglycinamide formyltransferase [Proteobacteria bacterium]|nr:phosphoribosylglycinamide formyltransferase [Pseudomonadota bacterium]